MAAPKKYSDELRERATRMALEARRDPATSTGAIKRVADLIHRAQDVRDHDLYSMRLRDER